MSHIIEIKTCHPKQHRGHSQQWWANCHCGCGFYAEPSGWQGTIEREAAQLIKKDGGIITRVPGVAKPRPPLHSFSRLGGESALACRHLDRGCRVRSRRAAPA